MMICQDVRSTFYQAVAEFKNNNSSESEALYGHVTIGTPTPILQVICCNSGKMQGEAFQA
ncbi:hypothetical protein HanRHA438_Chr07g0295761 [Helianthus annuus]|nr:hypothetical protein HanRHA438_Chr07g0295761 [Helianthus annuus]